MMTKNTSLQHMLLDSFKHLLWAHEQLALVLAPLPAAAFDQNLRGSFPGLRHCLHHMAAAEKSGCFASRVKHHKVCHNRIPMNYHHF
ncbi:MAG: hypothetical protein HWD58_09300 [Bacteroidota bacterium]|nr:MAG: hypothetical protein HWD58_09300 [Bacteroidota bacterium]